MTQLHNRLMVRERCQWRIKGAGRAAATEPPGAQIYSAKIIDAVMCLAAEFKKKLIPCSKPTHVAYSIKFTK